VVFGANFDHTHAYGDSLHLAAFLFLLPALSMLLLGRYREFASVESGAVLADGARTLDAEQPV
jgi:hypothetical protein